MSQISVPVVFRLTGSREVTWSHYCIGAYQLNKSIAAFSVRGSSRVLHVARQPEVHQCRQLVTMSWKKGGWNSGWWGQDEWNEDRDWSHHNWGGSKNREGEKDKYANVSTLGLKHPLPLEDRKELVVALLSRLQEEVGEAAAASAPGSVAGNFRMAVANWGLLSLRPCFFTSAEPSRACPSGHCSVKRGSLSLQMQ